MVRTLFHNKYFKFLTYLSVLIILIAINSPGLSSLPFGDDFIYIFDNHLLNQAPNPFVFWDPTSPFYRSWSLSFSIIWILSKLFGQNFLLYRVINILIHFFCGFLIYKIARLKRFKHPYIPALFFLFHPITSSTIFWIFQIKTTLASFFVILTTYFFFKNEKAKSLFTFLLSLVSKASGVLVPLAFVYSFSKKTRYILSALIISFILINLSGLRSSATSHLLETPFQSHNQLSNQLISDKTKSIVYSTSFFLIQSFGFKNELITSYEDLAAIPQFVYFLFFMLFLLAFFLFFRNIFFKLFILSLIPVIGIIYIPYHFLVPISSHWYYLAFSFFTLFLFQQIEKRWSKANILLVLIPIIILLSFNQSKSISNPYTYFRNKFNKYQSPIIGEYLYETQRKKGLHQEALDTLYLLYPKTIKKKLTLIAIKNTSEHIKSDEGLAFYNLAFAKEFLKAQNYKESLKSLNKIPSSLCKLECKMLKGFLLPLQ